MTQTKQSYKVLKPLELEHKSYQKDETVSLYPKQATYLVLGGFLEPIKTTQSTKTKTPTASKAKE